jgi:hypothetical protein
MHNKDLVALSMGVDQLKHFMAMLRQKPQMPETTTTLLCSWIEEHIVNIRRHLELIETETAGILNAMDKEENTE